MGCIERLARARFQTDAAQAELAGLVEQTGEDRRTDSASKMALVRSHRLDLAMIGADQLDGTHAEQVVCIPRGKEVHLGGSERIKLQRVDAAGGRGGSHPSEVNGEQLDDLRAGEVVSHDAHRASIADMVGRRGSEMIHTSETSNKQSEPTAGVLTGIRVVEFAQNLAVPTCGRLLAALGADVVKVEPPHGDATRTMAPIEGVHDGRAYVVTNPRKRSVVLDLGNPASAEARDALIRSADVVLCAFKGTDLERYGLTYDHVRSLVPEVVYLEHRAFGAAGPDADEGGYDVLVQAVSGLSFVASRSESGRPLTIRPAYSDMATGLASTAAVLAALYHRAQTGRGQRVRTSLLGTAHWLAMPLNARFDLYDEDTIAEFTEDLTLMRAAGAGFDDQRALYESRMLPAMGAFDIWFRHYISADGMVSIGALSPMLIDRFHHVTRLPDPRALKIAYRSPEWMSLVADAEALIASDTTDAWIERFRGAGVPCARYNTPMEAMNDAGSLANGFLHDVNHPVHGNVRMVASPLDMDLTPVRPPNGSPMLGEHTDEALREAGLSTDMIQSLRDLGVLGKG
jgi:crotonobetainyl-CoA:carnitine CoA-transferase CaiB-like acyl-CoA transferase